VLSVFERPQRLLTYIQPTSPRARARPFHVGRISDPALSPADFLLDREGGMKFMGALDGWMPGHEKIIYASCSGVSLTAFARRAVERFGRSPVPGVVEDGFFLRELEDSLVRSGAREKATRFYVEAAAKGVFFHLSGLSRETRRLMADGYRKFEPVPREPFILCATETISYGVNLPADALFLENVAWPRSRYRNACTIESLTPNEFRNLVGRVGRHGHMKPGVIPTVVVNWPLGKSLGSQEIFSRRREALAELTSSTPASEIDCRDLQRHLMLPTAPRLSDYPGPVGRFYLLAFLYASRRAGGGPVSAREVAGFLAETYTARSLFRGGDASARAGLLSGISGFLGHLAREFGSLAAESSRGPQGPKYLPGSLSLNLARNGTAPSTLKDLDSLLGGFAKGSDWLSPALYGLRTLLAVPLLPEMRDIFVRVFSDPRMIPPAALRKARQDPAEAEAWFRRRAEPVERLLEDEAGLSQAAAREMTGRIRSSGALIVERHLRENYSRAARNKEVTAFLREAFLQKALSTAETLLMWIDGRTVKSILAVAGSGLRETLAGPGPEGEGEGDDGPVAGKDSSGEGFSEADDEGCVDDGFSGAEGEGGGNGFSGAEGEGGYKGYSSAGDEGGGKGYSSAGDEGGGEGFFGVIEEGGGEGRGGVYGGGGGFSGVHGEGAAAAVEAGDSGGSGRSFAVAGASSGGPGGGGRRKAGGGGVRDSAAKSREDGCGGDRQDVCGDAKGGSEDEDIANAPPGRPDPPDSVAAGGPHEAGEAPQERRLKGGVDTNTFNYRYCDKAALVMDSYLAYCQAAEKISPEEAASLQAMAERARCGLRGEDLAAFVKDRRERGIGREEWLSRHREEAAGQEGSAGQSGL
jgi:hypothetical protein